MFYSLIEIKYKDWNKRIKEFILENKLAIIFVDEEIASVLFEMEVVNVQQFSSSTDYIILLKLKKPFESIDITHHYALNFYECDIRNSGKPFLIDSDKEILTKMFGGFDWLEMYQDINNIKKA